jgi:hypothetical protein
VTDSNFVAALVMYASYFFLFSFFASGKYGDDKKKKGTEDSKRERGSKLDVTLAGEPTQAVEKAKKRRPSKTSKEL